MAIDGRPMSELRDLMISLSSHAPGDSIVIEVKRDSETLLIPVELGVRAPAEGGRR
jgi:S1-C subfamily serine protease